MLCQRVKFSEDRALYEAWSTGNHLIFQLELPDIDLTKPILKKLGSDGIIGDDLDTFDLEILNPGGSVEHRDILVVHAHDFSKQFKVSSQSIFSVPLAFDTGESCWLSPLKTNSLDEYKSVNVDGKGVAVREWEWGGRGHWKRKSLGKNRTCCGSTMYLLAHGFHMPKPDICLESLQYIIWAMGGGGHTIVKIWDMAWQSLTRRSSIFLSIPKLTCL